MLHNSVLEPTDGLWIYDDEVISIHIFRWVN